LKEQKEKWNKMPDDGWKDLEAFRKDYDANSLKLKIVLGQQADKLPWNKQEWGLDVFLRQPIKEKQYSDVGTMAFVKKFLQHAWEQQQQHGGNVKALEISFTPPKNSGGKSKDEKHNFLIQVESWKMDNPDKPLSLVTTLIRTLNPAFEKAVNEGFVRNTVGHVQGFGLCSNEGPYKAAPEEPFPGANKGKAMVNTLPSGDAIAKTGEAVVAWYLKRLMDGGVNPTETPLVPHAGEEYYKRVNGFLKALLDARVNYKDKAVSFVEDPKFVQIKLKRIGHGIQLASPGASLLLDRVVDRKIVLEVCLTSNVGVLSTGISTGKFGRHPLLTLLDKKAEVALCSDDPSLFTNGDKGSILAKEYCNAARILEEDGHGREDVFSLLTKIASTSCNSRS